MKKCFLFIPILFLFYSCNIKEQSEIQKEVIASEEVIEINADALLKSFVDDSSAAADLYVGKVLSVKGTVSIFEQLDTIAFNKQDSLPTIVKWILKRVESDINTSNIFFKEAGIRKTQPSYTLFATFPREYRKEVTGIKEKSKVTIKGKLEHIATLSQQLPDSTNKTLTYMLSIQGCVLEQKK